MTFQEAGRTLELAWRNANMNSALEIPRVECVALMHEETWADIRCSTDSMEVVGGVITRRPTIHSIPVVLDYFEPVGTVRLLVPPPRL